MDSVTIDEQWRRPWQWALTGVTMGDGDGGGTITRPNHERRDDGAITMRS
jgi:hypothetical protein